MKLEAEIYFRNIYDHLIFPSIYLHVHCDTICTVNICLSFFSITSLLIRKHVNIFFMCFFNNLIIIYKKAKSPYVATKLMQEISYNLTFLIICINSACILEQDFYKSKKNQAHINMQFVCFYLPGYKYIPFSSTFSFSISSRQVWKLSKRCKQRSRLVRKNDQEM